MAKTYLGDGLYADHDGHQIVLTAENGVETTNAIYLDDAVLNAFIEWMRDNCNVEPRYFVCEVCGGEHGR